jgi:hypothetical protein
VRFGSGFLDLPLAFRFLVGESILERFDAHLFFAQGFDGADGGLAGLDRGDARYAMLDRRGANPPFVGPRAFAAGRVDNQGYAVVQQNVQQIGVTFGDLLDSFDRDSFLLQSLCRAFGRQQPSLHSR